MPWRGVTKDEEEIEETIQEANSNTYGERGCYNER